MGGRKVVKLYIKIFPLTYSDSSLTSMLCALTNGIYILHVSCLVIEYCLVFFICIKLYCSKSCFSFKKLLNSCFFTNFAPSKIITFRIIKFK